MVARVEGFRFSARARQASLIVDRLPAEGGSEEGFRPVELLLASLGTCMLGTMLTFANRQEISVRGVRLDLRPVIAKSPERLERVEMLMELEGTFSDRDLDSLKRVAERCKIHNTLHSTTETDLRIQTTSTTPSDTDPSRTTVN